MTNKQKYRVRWHVDIVYEAEVVAYSDQEAAALALIAEDPTILSEEVDDDSMEVESVAD